MERKLSSGSTWASVGTPGVDAESFTDNTGLVANTAYDYRVFAVNGSGDSPASNTASATTLPNPPLAPTLQPVTVVSQTQINLTWTDNSPDETGFRVERQLSSGGTWAPIATPAANATSYNDTGASAGTAYDYQVFAVNAGGDSPASGTQSGTTFPATPTNVQTAAGTPTQTAINLTWDASTGATDYKVERCTGAGSGCTPTVVIAASTTGAASFNDSGLTASTEYCYEIIATNASGDSPASAPPVCRTTAAPVSPPLAPTLQPVTVVSQTQINLTWTDNSPDETGFRVERQLSSGGTWAPIATPAANATSYNDTGASAGTAYDYQVFAVNAGGDSPASGTQSGTTFPATPTNVQTAAGTPTQTAINLTWDASTGATDYKVERCTGAGSGCTPTVVIAASTTGAASFNDSGLTASTEYCYEIIATNASGDSPASAPPVCRTTAAPVSPPLAPTLQPVTVVSQTQINLTWTDNSPDETGFRVERQLSSGGTWAPIATPAANATSYNDTGASAGTAYDYQVFAVNAGGDSPASGTQSGTTFPATPTNVQTAAGTPTQTAINLTWDASTGATDYKVERCTGAGSGCTPTVVIAASTTGAASFNDSGLTASTEYCYEIIATNASGDSPASAPPVCRTTAAPVSPPLAPTLQPVTVVSQTQINLTWTDNSPDETGFRVERQLSSGGTWAPIATPAANATSYNDTGASAGTAYDYQVFAVNAGGDSPASGTQSGTTFPATPTNVQTAAGTPTQTAINLTWDASTGATDYKVERCTGAGSGCTPTVVIAASTTGAASFNDSGLTASTEYCYEIIATNASGDSPASAPPVCRTTAAPVSPPLAPTLQPVTVVSQTQINLTWTDNSPDETGFRVERQLSSGGTWAPIATPAANATSYNDTGASAGTAYDYQVFAVNAGGDSPASGTQSGTTFPATPTNVQTAAGTPTQTAINLTWDASTGATDYKVERCTGAGSGCTPTVVIAASTTGAASFNDSGLTASTEYCYEIIATNASGDSPASAPPVCRTTAAPAPTDPTGLTEAATAVSPLPHPASAIVPNAH